MFNRGKFLTGSNNPSQTKRLGAQLARKIIKMKGRKAAVVLGLVGNLGGGKTTFLQGFARRLGIKEKVNSPTFVLMKRFNRFYHIDCYRLQKPKELLDMGFKKIISNPQNIVAIEWADKVKELLPKNVIIVEFEHLNQGTRKITISAP